MGGEKLGSPRGYLWAAQQFHPFYINIGDLEEEGAFSQLDMKSDIVRRTIFFAIKNYCLPIGEGLLGCSNVMIWIG